MSGKRFGVITILLALIILFCTKGTMLSMGDEERARENRHYLDLEQEYVRSAREFLNAQGLDNCGVMMTRVTNRDGTREYTVRVHHRKLEGMAGVDKETLKSRLSQGEFGDDVCTFLYDL